jgi:predicted negative regulator of RcsB-dependent stress response
MQDDIEQAQKIKQLWDTHGSSFLTGILLVICFLLAWQWWGSHKKNISISSQSSFLALMEASNAKDNKKIDFYANKIATDNPNSIYAGISNLFLAKLEIEKNNLNQAITFLKETAGQKLGIISQTATLRLARIYLAQNEPTKARMLLIKSNLFTKDQNNPVYQMLLANSDSQLKNDSAARAHLEKALEALDKDPISKAWVKMQLSNIPINKK